MRTRHLILPVLTALTTLQVGGAIGQTGPAFQPVTIDDQVSIGYGLAVADLDGDGRPDVLMADQTQIVWYRNGDWRRRVIAENLTTRDNVAIAARDIDGDGRAELAIGAQWNPGETSDTALSGAIRYLIRPQNPDARWEAVSLPHEPTTHRMSWVRLGADRYALVVAPLHGRDNRNNEGIGAKIIAYIPPADPRSPWRTVVLDSTMNATHNLDVVPAPGSQPETVLVGGKQGLIRIGSRNGEWGSGSGEHIPDVGTSKGIGEIRQGRLPSGPFYSTIEGMHGTDVVVYLRNGERRVLDSGLNEGHALATADLLGLGYDQVVAGWRRPASGKVGIRMYVPDSDGGTWTTHVVDDNAMAAEDLKVADLDGDGRPEIIAAGRASKNLVIYWNRSPRSTR